MEIIPEVTENYDFDYREDSKTQPMSVRLALSGIKSKKKYQVISHQIVRYLSYKLENRTSMIEIKSWL